MIKIKNKRIVGEIAVSTYKANLKRNIFTILSIIMTTFMITAILSIAVSYQKTIAMRTIRMNGMSYELALTEPEERQVKQIRAMDKVADAGLQVKCAIGEKYRDQSLHELHLYWLDMTAWEKQCIPALEDYEGNYPQKENEIMLSAGALNAMGIEKPKLGMKLPMTWYSVTENAAGESVEDEFILCGFFQDYTGWERGFVSESFYRKTGAKQTDFMHGKLLISLKNPLFSEKDIVELQKAISILPMQVVEGDTETAANFIRVVLVLFGLFLMIMVSGYLFIYNMLLISVSRDITCYGQLKTVGMTSSQLKSVVNRQVLWNCTIGIPLGLLCGILVTGIIVPAILTAANPMLETEDIVTAASPLLCLFAAFFSFLANWFGSRKPVQTVKQCSAIESMRYTGFTGNNTGRRKKRCQSGSLLSMAWSNLFRSPRQTVIILSSFIISVSALWIIHTVIQENDARRVLNTIYPYDIRLVNETTLDENKNRITEEKITEVKNVSGVKNVGAVLSADAVVPYQENLFDVYYKNLFKSRYTPGGNYEEDMEAYKNNPEESLFTSRIVGIDSVEFDKLNENLGGSLNKSKFDVGESAVIIKNFGLDVGNITGKEMRFWIAGDTDHAPEQSVKIDAIGEPKNLPAFFSGGYSPEIIVSRTFLEQLVEKPVTELIEVTYDEPFSANVEKQVKAIFKDDDQVSSDSKLERYGDMKKNSAQVAILGNSACLIILLLAFLNYFNMIAAGIEGRKVEFAILESIGMTQRQIKRMLTLEGAGYAVISLLGALALGIPLSYLVFNNLNIYGMEYLLPWQEAALSYAGILLLCVVLPGMLYMREMRTHTLACRSIIERVLNTSYTHEIRRSHKT